MDKYKSLAPVIVRIGIALVVMWFSINQMMNPVMWTKLVPVWAASLVGGNALTFVYLNAWFEIFASVMLILGLQIRVVSFLLTLHLIGIASSFGFQATGIRDFGLAIAALSIFFNGRDRLSLDTKLSTSSAAQLQ